MKSAHWSFVVTNTIYVLPIVLVLSIFSLFYSGVSNFIILIGSIVAMRGALREWPYDWLVKSYQHQNDPKDPVINGNQLNSSFFNEKAYMKGDRKKTFEGFVYGVIGTILSMF